MKRSKIARIVLALCAGVMMIAFFGGCAQQTSVASEEQAANRQYMSSVNTSIDELSDRLGGFEDAVSRGDTVAMRTQADNAFKVLDSLASLEAPEALKDVQTGYVDGCNALKDALNSYIALYTEIDSATEEHPFDYSTYNDRLKEIQDKYNDGLSRLEAADQKAAEL